MVGINENITPLTKRELQVLKLIAQGLSTKEISSSLGITFNTVETYRKRIQKKLNVRNCTEAVYHMTKLNIL